MDKQKTRAVLKIGSASLVLPVEHAVQVLNLLTEAEYYGTKSVDDSYVNVITTRDGADTWESALEMKIISAYEYTHLRMMGDKYREEKLKS